MTNATCAHCSAPMTGRKRKYCDRTCSMKAYGARRIADGRLAAQRERDAPRRAEWQKANRHRYDTLRACEACRREFLIASSSPTRTCTPGCDRMVRGGWSEPLPKDHWARWYGATSAWPRERTIDRRSDVRRAMDSGDELEIILAIEDNSTHQVNGCLIWNGRSRAGYPIVVGRNRKHRLVHRIMLEAHMGQPLGKQPVHHTCANTMCVHPRHLQLVTHFENNAEMMARRYFLQRIADLENALAEHDSEHPLLREVGVPAPQAHTPLPGG